MAKSSAYRRSSSDPNVSPSRGERSNATTALDGIIRRAVKARASDIHLEPKKDFLRVRYRVDGAMVEQKQLSPDISNPLISALKVRGRMDIAEKRIPQDGTFQHELSTAETVSIRASTFPCVEGEKVVLRVLRRGELISLEEVGMTQKQVTWVRRILARTGGLLLTTGPTGSGKTTTLYAMLSELDTKMRNVVTLEDPVEVQLSDVTQGQINAKAGFTFASGLRSILRQDPDVILVGEMRDSETASIALQASLTGHLVLSTLHTNSTVDTIIRLVDMGMEPYIVSNALAGVVAQRLLRKACPSCAEPYTLTAHVIERMQISVPEQANFVRPRGCAECGETGYSGRVGLFEVLEVCDRLRPHIQRESDTDKLRKVVHSLGFKSMRRVGFQLAADGITTLQEVLRLTQ